MSFNQYTTMGKGSQLTKTDVSILRFLIKNITKEYSIKMISENIKKAYPGVRENVLKMREESIIIVREINPTQNLCSLNLEDTDNINVFSYVESLEKDDYFSKNQDLKIIISDILDRIEGNSFTMMLFGSHVKRKEKINSDIDMLFLIPSIEDEGRIMNAVNSAERLTNKKIHAVVIAYDDFLNSISDEASLPREILENHIITYGAEAFYRSLMLWMRNSKKSLK